MKSLSWKLTVCMLGLMAVSRVSVAQSEIYASFVGSFSGMLVPLDGIRMKPGSAFGFGGGAHLFLNDFIYVDVGLTAVWSKANVALPQFADSYRAVDSEGEPFVFRYRVNGYRETIRYGTLSVPVSLNMLFGNKSQFYVALGGRFGYPFRARYRAVSNSLFTEGDYTTTHGDVLDGPEFAGFGTFAGTTGGNRLSFKAILAGSIELGTAFRFEPTGGSLFTGVFADFALTNIWNGARDIHPVEYTAVHPVEYSYGSILSASNPDNGDGPTTSNGRGAGVNNSLTPIMVGVRLKVTFDLSLGCRCRPTPGYRQKQQSVWRKGYL